MQIKYDECEKKYSCTEVLIELDSIEQVRADVAKLAQKFGIEEPRIDRVNGLDSLVSIEDYRLNCGQQPTTDESTYRIQTCGIDTYFALYGAVIFKIRVCRDEYYTWKLDFIVHHKFGSLREGFKLVNTSPIAEYMEDD